MASVTFYNFSKRKNSTKTPSGSGTSHTVNLKDGTSLYHPIFELTGAFPSYTYASWQGLLFYVTDITQIARNLYEIDCELDPMGSAAGDILSTSAFVTRSASSYDVYLKDIEVSAKQEILNTAYETTSMEIFDGTGCYILRVVGDNAGATGIATYAVDAAHLATILSWMFTGNNTFDAAWDSAIKAVFNPFQYIVSLKYTPISLSTFASQSTSQPVAFGWWVAGGGNVDCLTNTGGVKVKQLTKPTTLWGDFRDYDPEFTLYTLTLPGGNVVTLPSIWFSNSLYLAIIWDVASGDGELVLSTGNGAPSLASWPFKCAVELQIGQNSTDISGVIGDAAGAVGSYMSGNPIGLGISAAGAIGNILQPSPSVLGQAGCMQALISWRDPQLSLIRYTSGAVNTTTLGRPLNQTRTLSTLSGYTKCSEASVDTNLPEEYKDQINQMLNSGFFIE